MILAERIAQELVYNTLQIRLSEDIGISSGKIYLMSPDSLYVNERTEETNNLDSSRFPCISVTPYSQSYIWTQHNPVKVLDYDYVNMLSGQVKSYVSDLIIKENILLSIETTTKRDWRKYHDLMNRFFQKYRCGMTLVEDVFQTKESMHIIMGKDTNFDLTHAPFCSLFSMNVYYRMYSEEIKYFVNSIRTNLNTQDYNNNVPTGNVISTEIITTIE